MIPGRLRVGPVIEAVDAHAAGEPGRVIVGGVEGVPGGSMFEAMTWLQANRDDVRLRMLREPRGYPAANCNLVLPSSDPAASAGYVIMEQVEYPGMSGTNTMCVVTVLLETGRLPMTEPVTELTLESPAGLIRVTADCRDGKVVGVTFRNVPAFATHIDAPVEVPQLGTVVVDVAYGGMFYVIALAEQFGLRLTPDEGADIVRITEMIKAAANEQLPVVHPDQPGFAGITIGQLSGPAHDPANSMRNVVTVSTGTLDWDRPATWTGAIDRSPCGTGTSARMATLHARGTLGVGDAFRHEGILGTVFTGNIVEETRVGAYRAIVPTITGQAWITGFASYVVDPTDPFPDGFTIGDIWGMNRMKMGIVISAGDPRAAADLAAEAEAAGWDGAFYWDAVAIPGLTDIYDPWVVMAAMAMRTERVTLGAILSPPSRRRPWKLARETMTLDRLSNGRLVVPVGLGALDDLAFGNVGEPTDARTRAEMLDESLAILEGLWSGEPFGFEGRHYRFDPMTFRPTPVQMPRIPIWVVGQWPKERSVARALRFDGILPETDDPEQLRALAERVGRERPGDPFEIVVEGTTPDDPVQAGIAIAPLAAAGATWWTEADWSDATVESLRRRIVAGPPRVGD